ncbi:MAG: DNA repair protein RecN [Clostridia bacterium]|nr:DNA repair protein RecN [Clostridia bacterium]
MLASLHVKNIAVIKDISINFGNGLNIMTGETGAGKSIIIDSINFVLGDRAEKNIIRSGEENAEVEAVFILNSFETILSEILNNNGIDWNDGILIIRRTLNINGRGEIRVNGFSVTLSFLKSIVSYLLDVHSQHETQSLLNENNHLKILDAYAAETNSLNVVFLKKLKEFKSLQQVIESFPQPLDIEHQMDLLNFQINEIEESNFHDFEEESLIKERNVIQNSEKILSSLVNAISLLEGNDIIGIETIILNLLKEISFLNRFDYSYGSILDRLESILIEIRDIKNSLDDSLKNIDYDENKLQSIEKRIEQIRMVKRKYGSDEESIKSFLLKSIERRNYLSNAEQNISEISSSMSSLKKELTEIGLKLHELRVSSSKSFVDNIVKQLNDLGMKNASFSVSVELLDDFINSNFLELSLNGPDKIKFLISLNKGEPLKDLKRVASGGEMSRIMLAIKNITANLEGIDTLIFDEIDSGISGNAAKTVSQKLFNISIGRQVIVVTHLSQIAAMADLNYLIHKHVSGDETLTYVSQLDEEGVINELMRISGSNNSSKAGYLSSKELRDWATDYKTKKNQIK